MAKNKRRSKNQQSSSPSADKSKQVRPLRAIGLALLVVFILAVIYIFYPASSEEIPDTGEPRLGAGPPAGDPNFPIPEDLTLFWGHLPDQLSRQLQQVGTASNIHPRDYVGPNACKDCHKKNHRQWSHHPHRFMNALATDEIVVGDFTGKSIMNYKGGKAAFYQEGAEYRMRYERGDFVRSYKINQTIGSRFFQYYVGQGLEGPERKDHDYYHDDHVLPFGYWIERKAWVPVVHVHEELADDERWDPLFSLVKPKTNVDPQSPHAQAPSDARGVTHYHSGDLALRYATTCNFCHTTFPLADMFVRMRETKSQHIPAPMFLSVDKYLADSRPDIWNGSRPADSISHQELDDFFYKMVEYEAPKKAVTLGVSCEACHLGCKAHSEQDEDKPSFVAKSPFLLTPSNHLPQDPGRSHANLNWICSRCHNGNRPKYAAGISTWNSTEFTDASRGACYSELSCIQCHDPHEAIGPTWTKTPAQDDASCLSCHRQFSNPVARKDHTHHPAGSTGDRCMNCHMPKINEGMQDVVRTHTIFSPTQGDMIEANHPNACNLCHLEKPIDWTLEHLESWYGKRYSRIKLDANYPKRKSAVGLGWLEHKDEAVRLVAVDALARADADWALPQLIDSLDDDFLLNRQFTQKGLEDKLSIKLNEQFGYWFYMTKDERRRPIERIRASLLKANQGKNRSIE